MRWLMPNWQVSQHNRFIYSLPTTTSCKTSRSLPAAASSARWAWHQCSTAPKLWPWLPLKENTFPSTSTKSTWHSVIPFSSSPIKMPSFTESRRTSSQEAMEVRLLKMERKRLALTNEFFHKLELLVLNKHATNTMWTQRLRPTRSSCEPNDSYKFTDVEWNQCSSY